MTPTHLSLPAEAPETYEDLVHLYPPRKIHDQIELENATEVADWIALRAKNDAQLDYLETLGFVLDEYENRSGKSGKLHLLRKRSITSLRKTIFLRVSLEKSLGLITQLPHGF